MTHEEAIELAKKANKLLSSFRNASRGPWVVSGGEIFSVGDSEVVGWLNDRISNVVADSNKSLFENIPEIIKCLEGFVDYFWRDG